MTIKMGGGCYTSAHYDISILLKKQKYTEGTRQAIYCIKDVWL